VHESRKKATAQNKIDMFLRRPKIQASKSPSNAEVKIESVKAQGSFKSSLERYH
jgi:hypothetical protein